MVYMIGFMKLLRYPSHTKRLMSIGSILHAGWLYDSSRIQMAFIMLTVKKGNQHSRNTPGENERRLGLMASSITGNFAKSSSNEV